MHGCLRWTGARRPLRQPPLCRPRSSAALEANKSLRQALQEAGLRHSFFGDGARARGLTSSWEKKAQGAWQAYRTTAATVRKNRWDGRSRVVCDHAGGIDDRLAPHARWAG